VADLTALGLFGTVAQYNDADFTRPEDIKAYGVYTALGLFGMAAEYNPANFVRVDVRVTKTVAFSAALDATFTDFDDWTVRAISPAYLDGAVDQEFGKANAEIDDISIAAESTYMIEVEIA